MENVEYIQQSASPRPVVSLYSVPSMIKGERRQLPVFRQRLAALSLAAF
ncbi:MAG TPA: hypothetical protein PLP17_13725 [Oligoflexia bacterium]|nr:hypothetical protein [Oligoflexia bacterium]